MQLSSIICLCWRLLGKKYCSRILKYFGGHCNLAMLFLKLILSGEQAGVCVKYICALSLHVINPTSTLDMTPLLFIWQSKWIMSPGRYSLYVYVYMYISKYSALFFPFLQYFHGLLLNFCNRKTFSISFLCPLAIQNLSNDLLLKKNASRTLKVKNLLASTVKILAGNTSMIKNTSMMKNTGYKPVGHLARTRRMQELGGCMRTLIYSNNLLWMLRDAADREMHLLLVESSSGVSTPTLRNGPITLDYEGLATKLQTRTFN